jgi:hypothetical protein
MISNNAFMITDACAAPPAFMFTQFTTAVNEFLVADEVEPSIGMLVTAGFALIDTAAQHGTIGPKDYRKG